MKCKNCPAMQRDSYEYEEYSCAIGVDSIEFKDGSLGCLKYLNTIERLLQKRNIAMADEHGNMFEFFKEEERKNKALTEAIKRVIFKGNNYLCGEYPDGMFIKKDVDFMLEQHVFEIRELYEKLLEEKECTEDLE